MPRVVVSICHTANAWIVGSAADPACERPGDVDIVVSHATWHLAAPQIPPNAAPNKFGGWRFTSDGVEIDLWPDDLGRLLSTGNLLHAYCPSTNVRISKS